MDGDGDDHRDEEYNEEIPQEEDDQYRNQPPEDDEDDDDFPEYANEHNKRLNQIVLHNQPFSRFF